MFIRANDLMKSIHERMPVILPPERYDEWMDDQQADTVALTSLLQPFPSARMMMHTVSTVVNSPRNDGPDLITASR